MRWRDVSQVRVRGVNVVLDRHNGRRVTLPYPTLMPGRASRQRFEADVARVREHWLTHRNAP